MVEEGAGHAGRFPRLHLRQRRAAVRPGEPALFRGDARRRARRPRCSVKRRNGPPPSSRTAPGRAAAADSNAVRKTCCALRVSDYDRVAETGNSRPEPEGGAYGGLQDHLGQLAHRRAAGHVYGAVRSETAQPRAAYGAAQDAGRAANTTPGCSSGQQVGTLGAVMQAGQRFEDPSQIDFLGVWEDVRKGAYDAACDDRRKRGGRHLGLGVAAEPGTVLVPRAGQRAAVARSAAATTTGSPISASRIPIG